LDGSTKLRRDRANFLEKTAGTGGALDPVIMKNDKRIYLAGARTLAWFSIAGIAAAGVGAALAHGVSRSLPFEARTTMMELASTPPIEERNNVRAQGETSAAAIGIVGATKGGELKTAAPTILAPKQPPNRPSCRRAASLAAAPRGETMLQAAIAPSEPSCRMLELRMGPIGRSVRYCEF
jgi:hypothetical protein